MDVKLRFNGRKENLLSLTQRFDSTPKPLEISYEIFYSLGENLASLTYLSSKIFSFYKSQSRYRKGGYMLTLIII